MNPSSALSATINVRNIREILSYCKANLYPDEYAKCKKALKAMITRIVLCIIIAFAISITGFYLFRSIYTKQNNELLSAYGATHSQGVIRKNDTTVQYTKGTTFLFDTAEVGITSLNESYPGERSFTVLLDDNGNLKGLLGEKDKPQINWSAIGLLFAFLEPLIVISLYALHLMFLSPCGKDWKRYRDFALFHSAMVLDKDFSFHKIFSDEEKAAIKSINRKSAFWQLGTLVLLILTLCLIGVNQNYMRISLLVTVVFAVIATLKANHYEDEKNIIRLQAIREIEE